VIDDEPEIPAAEQAADAVQEAVQDGYMDGVLEGTAEAAEESAEIREAAETQAAEIVDRAAELADDIVTHERMSAMETRVAALETAHAAPEPEPEPVVVVTAPEPALSPTPAPADAEPVLPDAGESIAPADAPTDEPPADIAPRKRQKHWAFR
jgi:hypothetical protein